MIEATILSAAIWSFAGCNASSSEPAAARRAESTGAASRAIVDDACTTNPRCFSRPIPFLMQYADTYETTTSSTVVRSLTLSPDGSYQATLTDGTHERGAYTSCGAATLPFTFVLSTGSHRWTGQITTTDGAMTLARDGVSDSATPSHAVGPNESLCDATHGQWTDDDADAATGLYCLCPAGTTYVPAQGGCVAIDRDGTGARVPE